MNDWTESELAVFRTLFESHNVVRFRAALASIGAVRAAPDEPDDAEYETVEVVRVTWPGGSQQIMSAADFQDKFNRLGVMKIADPLVYGLARFPKPRVWWSFEILGSGGLPVRPDPADVDLVAVVFVQGPATRQLGPVQVVGAAAFADDARDLTIILVRNV